jgi:SGNH domain (fused to AT3 domains)
VLTATVLMLGAIPAMAVAPDSDKDGLSDAFETAYGLNPLARDSDGDGIRDGAEDQDGDSLSNLGEQRFGNNPNNADTDSNGTLDGADDKNHDGVPDAKEQDSGPVPANLKPTLQGARKDRPLGYTDGCHSDTFDAQIHPCVYGSGMATRTIAVFGDSHAQQWMPAMIAAAQAHRWRVVSLTKSACPAVQVKYQNPTFPGSETSCHTWRLRAEAWLRDHPPSVIVISDTRGYRLIGTNGQVLSGVAFEDRWHNGLVKTLDNLPASSGVVVLGDTPHMRNDIPVCLQAHLDDVSACQTARADAWRTTHDQAEATAAAQRGATFVSLNATICSYDPCPIVINELLMWRDAGHLTATYTVELAPAIAAVVVSAINRLATDHRQPLLAGGP